MCLGNRAEVSAHYVNSQLRALWENSQKCIEKHGNGLKPSRSDLEYGFAFSEFYFGKHNRYHPTKDDLSFFASFGCPRLEFVCNHEVILYLDLKEGHCNVEPKIGRGGDIKHSFAGYTIAFRIEFTGHSISNVSVDAIGNAPSYELNLIVLDVNSASFASDLSHGHDGLDFNDHAYSTIVHYLSKHYLGLLKRAGHHVLYTLPDFDNLSRTQTIDYSIIADRSLTTTEIFGISVVQVNRYLKGLWLQAAAHIDEHGTGDEHSSYKSYYLAEHRSAWTESHEDIQFHAFFGPLQVQGLCRREVVVYLDIQDVNFYIGEFSDIPNHKFSDWKIALIVDLIFEESEQGSVKTLKLDLNTARFCEHLSVFKGDFGDMELFHRLRTTLIRYITVHYLTILEESGHRSIYTQDTRIVHKTEDDESSGEDDEEIFGCWCEDEADCGHTYVHGHVYWGRLFRERIIRPHVHDYDLVMAVSQGSINKHWKLLWEASFKKAEAIGLHEHHGKYDHDRTLELQIGLSLADYVFEKEGHVHFSSSFGAPQVQLVCSPGSHKAIIYFQLRDGFLRTLGVGKSYNASGAEHHFSRLTLAFEVDLKLRDSSDHHKSSDAIVKYLGHSDQYSFRQLILDFRTAKFSDSRSALPDLFDGSDYRLIRSKREALIHYFIHHYFPTLIVAGHDVLYTLPTWKKGTHAHSITSLTFQITPFTFGPNGSFVEGIHGRQRAIFDRNCIVFLGMTDGRQLPSTPLPASGNWASGFGKEVTYGTVTLSRRTFLEGKLLSLLARINARTTVVPSFSGVEDGEWILQLTTWDQHPRKKDRECRWREIPNHAANALEFDWINLDRWNYEHEGDEGSNGSYRVSCETRNKLSIPTNTTGSGVCAIKMSGTVVLKLSYQGISKQWHNEVSARWSSTITMSSDGAHGLTIHISPERIVPDFHDHRAEGELGRSTFASAFALLQAQFHTAISFGHVVRELKSSFEGAWPLLFTGSDSGRLATTSPTFNYRGDFILGLNPHVDILHHKRSAYSSLGRTVHQNGDTQGSLGFFRTISEKVERVVESHLSLRSPPPHTPTGGKTSPFEITTQEMPVEVEASNGDYSDVESDI